MSSTAHNLIIRADANRHIGTGHIMRCIALGQAWRDAGGEVVFLTSCENVVLLQRLHDECFKVVEMKGDSDIILALQPFALNSWVIFDGYHFDLEQQRQVRNAGYKLLLLDDYCHLAKYECDILVNQNIGAAKLDYRTNPDAKLLLGCDYAMLRREFRHRLGVVDQKRMPGVTNLLVTLGGADPDNATLKVVEALILNHTVDIHAKVIIGPANSHGDLLEEAIGSRSYIELVDSVKDMPALIDWADIAISAGGSTCWELCCTGVPFGIVVLAENQRALAKALEDYGVAICLGENPAVRAIASVVDRLTFDLETRCSLSAASRALIDGFGVDRILHHIAKGMSVDLFEGRLGLRPASEADCELFWEWTNDPVVRGNSYDSEPISLDEHCEWFNKKRTEEGTCLMLVLDLDGMPVGQIRFDRKDDVAIIGFSISRKFRGMGLGPRIVEESLGQAMQCLSVRSFRAEVFEANPASKAAFDKAGFELADTCVIKGIPSHVFIRKYSQ